MRYLQNFQDNDIFLIAETVEEAGLINHLYLECNERKIFSLILFEMSGPSHSKLPALKVLFKQEEPTTGEKGAG